MGIFRLREVVHYFVKRIGIQCAGCTPMLTYRCGMHYVGKLVQPQVYFVYIKIKSGIKVFPRKNNGLYPGVVFGVMVIAVK